MLLQETVTFSSKDIILMYIRSSNASSISNLKPNFECFALT